MPATRSTTKRQQRTQNFRQNVVRQDRGDYYQCNLCGGLLSLSQCTQVAHSTLQGKNKRQRDEEAQMLTERYTPTPKPYTHVSSSEDIEFGGEFDMGVAMDHGVPIFQHNPCCSYAD